MRITIHSIQIREIKQESPQTRKLIYMVALINRLCETIECTIISTVWKTYMYCLSSNCVKHLLVLSSRLCETLTCTIIQLWDTYLYYHPPVGHLLVLSSTCVKHYLVLSSDCVKHYLVLSSNCGTLTCTIIQLWDTYLY